MPESRMQRVLLAGVLIMSLSTCSTRSNTDEWHTLFAENNSSWSVVGDATWTFNDGELVASDATTNSFIVTNKNYDNFRLRAEFYPLGETNSGVYFRCDREQLTATECYEANIADNHQDETARTGSLVGHVAPSARSETIGRWNQYEILAEGSRIKIWTNGVQTVDFSSATKPQGVVALQLFAAGEIRFRNVRIQEL